ncbi:hypothetical protein BS50DRAFT_591675 [Corynespora cassiicola Philippines]|uniref:Uncharacterized protein n=1 Tax=Corynespora cassiicola Philippines TaxID=1448308 RepID=A0A2T2NAF1_CORCC|nr:hypothetical protein BS50DRAFT_591675 [Corynespora cassiicola Philippines]
MLTPLRLLLAARTQFRSLATTSRLHQGPHPKSNQPSTQNGAHRSATGKGTPNTDPQSSASDAEHLSGQDHPAKKPDPQVKPARRTGIGGVGGQERGWEGDRGKEAGKESRNGRTAGEKREGA